MRNLIREGICSVGSLMTPYMAAKAANKRRFNVQNMSLKTNSLRYRTFAKSGTVCRQCGREVLFFAFERQDNQAICHANAYGYDEAGDEVLFTKDHIKPLSAGGSNSAMNLQTMCEPCNMQKGKQYNG